jgi:hypothetical protein
MRTKELEETVQIDDTVIKNGTLQNLRVIEVRGRDIRAVASYGKNEYNQKIKYVSGKADDFTIVKKSKKFRLEQEQDEMTDEMLAMLSEDDSTNDVTESDELLNLL